MFGMRTSLTSFLKKRTKTIFCSPPKNILKIYSNPQFPTKCLNKKSMFKVEIASKEAIRADVLLDPLS